VGGDAVRGLFEREGQQVGPTDQASHIHPDLLGPASKHVDRPRDRTFGGRATDTGLRYLGIVGLQIRHQTNLDVPLSDERRVSDRT
jgi:hypothetical protein